MAVKIHIANCVTSNGHFESMHRSVQSAICLVRCRHFFFVFVCRCNVLPLNYIWQKIICVFCLNEVQVTLVYDNICSHISQCVVCLSRPSRVCLYVSLMWELYGFSRKIKLSLQILPLMLVDCLIANATL